MGREILDRHTIDRGLADIDSVDMHRAGATAGAGDALDIDAPAERVLELVEQLWIERRGREAGQRLLRHGVVLVL